MTKTARCTKAAEPDHRLAANDGTFLTSAEVIQGWRVDQYGEFIETTSECLDVLHKPDRDNYDCAVDGCGGEVEWIDTDPPPERVEPTEPDLLTLVRSLLDSEDDTGCDGDLTVVSKQAIEALKNAVAAGPETPLPKPFSLDVSPPA